MNFVSWAVLLVGAWAVINGVLHDIFVLRSEHGKVYDRNLLRFLMDGHILITCGILQMLAYRGIEHHALWAYCVVGVASASLIVYCAMIWPFLKSVVTTVINIALVVMLLFGYFGN